MSESEITEFHRLPKEKQARMYHVASAICKAAGLNPDALTSPDPSDDGAAVADVIIQEWRNYIPHARAAIIAMDEPIDRWWDKSNA
jgi:hypothetical protein